MSRENGRISWCFPFIFGNISPNVIWLVLMEWAEAVETIQSSFLEGFYQLLEGIYLLNLGEWSVNTF